MRHLTAVGVDAEHFQKVWRWQRKRNHPHSFEFGIEGTWSCRMTQMVWLHAVRVPWSGPRCGIFFVVRNHSFFPESGCYNATDVLSNTDWAISKQLFLQQLVSLQSTDLHLGGNPCNISFQNWDTKLRMCCRYKAFGNWEIVARKAVPWMLCFRPSYISVPCKCCCCHVFWETNHCYVFTYIFSASALTLGSPTGVGADLTWLDLA